VPSPERAIEAAGTTDVEAASAPVTGLGAEQTASRGVSARVWWALALLAAGLAVVAIMLGRGERKRDALDVTHP
jgi:hypothetical protein